MPVRLTAPTIDACPLVARKILMTFKNRHVFAFSGKMGSGKTTLIKFLCNELGVIDFPSSPSFSLVNEYTTASNEKIYHFDFYRIKNINEVFNIGYEEYFFSGHYCFIEWPEKIQELLPDNCVYIKLEDPDNPLSRSLVFDPDK
jgi:tRNA threonylcarbamoyladenosine biosynthesis protein TsaE